MNLCALHEAVDAAWAPIAPIDGGPTVAAVAAGNPLAPDWALPPAPPASLAVMWSGSLAGDLRSPHPANWMPAGRTALDDLCRRLGGAGCVCLRPHARHVLSDVPSCRRFLADHGGRGFGVALSPATMLEPSMLATAEDHLGRLFEGLGGACALLFLQDVVVDAAADACRPVPLGEGVLPLPVLVDLAARHVPAHVPVVLEGPRLDEQRRRLGCDPGACRRGRYRLK